MLFFHVIWMETFNSNKQIKYSSIEKLTAYARRTWLRSSKKSRLDIFVHDSNKHQKIADFMLLRKKLCCNVAMLQKCLFSLKHTQFCHQVLVCHYSIVIFIQLTCSCMLHSTMSQRSYMRFPTFRLKIIQLFILWQLFDCHVVVAAAGSNTRPPGLYKQLS